LHLRNTDEQPLAPLHHTPLWKNVWAAGPDSAGGN